MSRFSRCNKIAQELTFDNIERLYFHHRYDNAHKTIYVVILLVLGQFPILDSIDS